MTLPLEVDVLVVGAGPAGLAAATELAPHCKVLVVDREPAAGGIPRHCGHYPFGLREFRRMMKGPDYARALVARAESAGARIALNVNVTALRPGPEVCVTSDAGPSRITARRVLLATGVRESSRAQRLIGGEKPGGILPTGALQSMVYLEGRRPFRHPVILGTELVSFSALMTCAHAGIRPVAMIEPNAGATARWPTTLFPRLKGVPLHLSTRLLAINGRDRVESVLIEGPSGQELIETDGVIISGDFRPEGALLANSHILRDPATGGPQIDSAGHCSDPSYFAAGNLLRPVETAGWCWSEGSQVGRAILADLQGKGSSTSHPITLADSALAWVVPQMVTDANAFEHLQLRVNRPVKGRLSIRVGNVEVASRSINTRPERRILLPMPKTIGPAVVMLDEI